MSSSSIIELSPASATFVADRVNTLGPWVLSSFTDCILMGIVLCQVNTFFRTVAPSKTPFQRYCYWLVIVVSFLSVLKTIQEISVVWIQNVHDYANPDAARLLVTDAWWQVSTPLMTGVIGCAVQSFFCIRFYLLSRNWRLVIPMVCCMTLGITGICLTVNFILRNNTVEKVRWLLIHLIGVFSADLLITIGTWMALRKRAEAGLERTTLLVNRLLRMVFESAIPPTVIALIDLIMTQTLGPKLLWHLLLNFSLGKIYVISLLYTLNSINEYRRNTDHQSHDIYTATGHVNKLSKPNNVELGTMSKKPDQIYIQTQVSTHRDISSPVKGRAIQASTLDIHTLDKHESGTTLAVDFNAGDC
ncbi:hypothetical protein DFH07DRAFT_856852 [Mycena maculata]|uniref:DUF6534 domain-containing protein n=1 Tax=Mycena maculata TaxID=230809 RepID=A0AAD7HKA1_9AGAR|nr:hypothetical protein DFH07DRAFT_856852 [Mycena maculata]